MHQPSDWSPPTSPSNHLSWDASNARNRSRSTAHLKRTRSDAFHTSLPPSSPHRHPTKLARTVSVSAVRNPADDILTFHRSTVQPHVQPHSIHDSILSISRPSPSPQPRTSRHSASIKSNVSLLTSPSAMFPCDSLIARIMAAPQSPRRPLLQSPNPSRSYIRSPHSPLIIPRNQFRTSSARLNENASFTAPGRARPSPSSKSRTQSHLAFRQARTSPLTKSPSSHRSVRRNALKTHLQIPVSRLAGLTPRRRSDLPMSSAQASFPEQEYHGPTSSNAAETVTSGHKPVPTRAHSFYLSIPQATSTPYARTPADVDEDTEEMELTAPLQTQIILEPDGMHDSATTGNFLEKAELEILPQALHLLSPDKRSKASSLAQRVQSYHDSIISSREQSHEVLPTITSHLLDVGATPPSGSPPAVETRLQTEPVLPELSKIPDINDVGSDMEISDQPNLTLSFHPAERRSPSQPNDCAIAEHQSIADGEPDGVGTPQVFASQEVKYADTPLLRPSSSPLDSRSGLNAIQRTRRSTMAHRDEKRTTSSSPPTAIRFICKKPLRRKGRRVALSDLNPVRVWMRIMDQPLAPDSDDDEEDLLLLVQSK